MFKYFICLIFVTISSYSLANMTNCAYELSKLKSIQRAMRTIYNSENMIIEEQRRYAIYRNCKESVKSKFTKNKKNKLYKSKKSKPYKKSSASKSNKHRKQFPNSNTESKFLNSKSKPRKSKPKPRKVNPDKIER